MMLKSNGRGSYTVDSGAEESVCPWEWGSQFDAKPVQQWIRFKNASGGGIEHYGQMNIHVVSLF